MNTPLGEAVDNQSKWKIECITVKEEVSLPKAVGDRIWRKVVCVCVSENEGRGRVKEMCMRVDVCARTCTCGEVNK